MEGLDFEFDGSGVAAAALDDRPALTITTPPDYVRDTLLKSPDREIEYAGPRKPSSRSSRGALYFDLETTPDYDRLHTFGLDPVPEVPNVSDVSKLPDMAKLITGTADAVRDGLRGLVCPEAWLNDLISLEAKGKDRSTVKAHIEAARGVRADAIQAKLDRVKLLSTTPEYCAICCMGWAVGNDTVCSLTVGQPVGDVFGPGESRQIVTERFILEMFWSMAAKQTPLVAYNGLYFDLPVIFVRSAIIGVQPTRMLDTKPWGKDVVDPYILRFGSKGNSDKSRPGRLKQLAPLYGIEVPGGDVEGSQVDELMRTDPAKVGEYCRSDVEILRALHRSLSGYFWA